jgi:hypothetical protein
MDALTIKCVYNCAGLFYDLKAHHVLFGLRHYKLRHAECRVCLSKMLERADTSIFRYGPSLRPLQQESLPLRNGRANQVLHFSQVLYRCTQPEARLNVERNTPSGISSLSDSAEPAKPDDNGNSSADRPAPNVWRRHQPSHHVKEIHLGDMPTTFSHQQKAVDPDIPAFLRKQKK